MRNKLPLHVLTLLSLTDLAPSYGQTVSRLAKWSRWTECVGSSSSTQQRLRTQTENRVCPTVIPLSPCGQCPEQCAKGEVDHLSKRTKCKECRVVTQSCTCPCNDRVCASCNCLDPPTITFETLVCSPEGKWIKHCGFCPDHCSVVLGDLDSPIGCEKCLSPSCPCPNCPPNRICAAGGPTCGCNNDSLVCGSNGEWIREKREKKQDKKQEQKIEKSSKITFGK